MSVSFRTISTPTEGFFKDRGSKFLSFAYPVQSVDEVKDIVDLLRKEYHDARHHCFAHVIGFGPQVKIRANDDGEPNHTAGDPIIGQIKSLELTDTLVVVVRYFGGTKLGVSGLINAYREAATDALQKARIVVRYIKQEFLLNYGYEQTNDVLRILSEFEVEMGDQQFTEKCSLTGRVDPERYAAMRAKLEIIGLEIN